MVHYQQFYWSSYCVTIWHIWCPHAALNKECLTLSFIKLPLLLDMFNNMILLTFLVDEVENLTFVSLSNDTETSDALVYLVYKKWNINKSLTQVDKLGLFRIIEKCAVISTLPCCQKQDFISSKTNYNAIKKLRVGISRILKQVRYSYTCVINLALWTNARLLRLTNSVHCSREHRRHSKGL